MERLYIVAVCYQPILAVDGTLRRLIGHFLLSSSYICVSILVILAASVFEILYGKTDRQTAVTTVAMRLSSSAWVTNISSF